MQQRNKRQDLPLNVILHCDLSRPFCVNDGRIKYGNRNVGLANQQAKLGAAQDDALCSSFFQLFNNALKSLSVLPR